MSRYSLTSAARQAAQGEVHSGIEMIEEGNTVKSREERKRKAQRGGIWTLAVVSGLLLVYVLVTSTPTWVAAMTPLITATAALGGVYLGSWLTQRRQREDEQRRRQALATILLSEVKLLYHILKDIFQASYLKGLHVQVIESFHTAMYDQAGADRLLFTPETTHALAAVYQNVHTLRVELNRSRDVPADQRLSIDEALRVRTHYTAEQIEEVMHKLSGEGGIWPRDYPRRIYTIYPEDTELRFPPVPEPPRR
jgi:hypothetical protein